MWQFALGGLGWHPDLPDPRDYTPEHEQVARLLGQLKARRRPASQVDWREFCPAPNDHARAEASAADACLGLTGYFLRCATGEVLDPSAMFIHQAAQRVQGWRGSGRCELRATWKTILRFGIPPEAVWPYDPAAMDREPDAFVYASARRFSALRYVRVDPAAQSGEETLRRVKAFLAAGFACVFGFPVSTAVSREPDIPFPTIFDAVRGGQAVLAAGFDDGRRIRSDRGALLVRTSWGQAWGEQGYGWLPYAYVRERLARDFWTVVEPEWLASGEFHRPE